MILPQTSSLVLTIAVLSLLFLGAWATTFKAAGAWRFELYYFDFAFGVALTALIFSFTLGDLGYDGFSFIDDLQHAGKRQWLFCFLAGVVINLGNMLLMGAISVSGLSIAFPVAMGFSILISAALGFLVKTSANPALIMMGCALIFVAIVVSAIAYRIKGIQRHEQLARAGVAKSTRRPNPIKGVLLAMAGGLLMGSVGGLIARSREGDLGLGPYAVSALIGLAVFLSSFVFNIFFMNLPVEGEPAEFAAYFKGKLKQHLMGLLGGVLWYSGLLGAMVATHVPETLQPAPLPRFLLSHGSAIAAAIFGILFLRELRGSDMRVKVLAVLMITLFACGLAMIGLSPTYAIRRI
jgi:glucose uptake protein